MESAKLILKKDRFKTKSELRGELYTTQYTNGVYTVFINEDDEEIYFNARQKDILYPTVDQRGINVPATGTLTKKELEEHIERLQFAYSTYEQAVALVKEFYRK